MEKNLQDLEQFFKYDMEIKQLMAFYPDIYDNKSLIDYINKTYKNLQDIKYMLEKMLQFIGADETLTKYLNKRFRDYEKTLLKSMINRKRLAEFYQTCISNMNPELVDEINHKIKGYYVFCNYQEPFLKSKTINELLHVLHSYVVNNENFYEAMPIIEEKTNEKMQRITLRGHKSEIAKAIFDNVSFDLDSDYMDILSLSNGRILIMARDLGHALTIEIEKENDKVHVSYFIPKVCNIDMVNNLKGITPIKINEDTDLRNLYAKGSFEVTEQELIPNLLELMMNIPQDKDIIIKDEFLKER